MSGDEVLDRRALNRALLARQMLLRRVAMEPVEAIERLAGLQAQDPAPPFVALWSRLDGFRREALVEAAEGRRVVRAPAMRATLHLVTARDLVALRAPLQPALDRAFAAVGDTGAGIDVPAVVAAAREILAEGPRPFAELRALLSERFPDANHRGLGYCVRTHLPLVAVPAPTRWGWRPNPEFADAEAWLGEPVDPDPDPRVLVLRYLAAFGPATAADVAAWSGLPALRGVLDDLRDRLAVFRDEAGRELLDLYDAPRPDAGERAPARLLAAFDSAILGHADRSRIVPDEHRPRLVTRNLRVPATVLVDGFVAGTWTLDVARRAATLTITPFGRLPRGARPALRAEAERLLRFAAEGSGTRTVEFA
ncbi:MAG: winged helix DNA-binding domain-containing protein [Thermoleophilia bacterium]